jgi:hypothetical protein
MSLYIPGGKWSFAAGGRQGSLEIRFEGGDRFTGKITITGEPVHPIEGRWDEGRATIYFTTTDAPFQAFRGGLAFPLGAVPVNATYTLAGTYDDLLGSHAWFAQQTVIP